MPKVSVIIPTFNCSKYIPEAIESVLRQTYPDFEIIIVDDGSTDNTRDTVENCISNNRGKIYYYYQDNKGPGAARNKGINEAKGEYIAFLDADDLIPKDSIEKRVNFLEKCPEISLAFTDYYINTNEYSTQQQVLKNCDFLNKFRKRIIAQNKNEIVFGARFICDYLNFTPHPIFMNTVMLRKEITKEVGLFRTDIFIGEDIDFWVKIIKWYRIGYIDQPLAYYRHNISKLTKQTERFYIDTVKLYHYLYQNNPARNIGTILKRKLSKSYFELGYYYKNSNMLDRSRACLLRSILLNPLNIKPYKTLLGMLLPNKIKNKVTLNAKS